MRTTQTEPASGPSLEEMIRHYDVEIGKCTQQHDTGLRYKALQEQKKSLQTIQQKRDQALANSRRNQALFAHGPREGILAFARWGGAVHTTSVKLSSKFKEHSTLHKFGDGCCIAGAAIGLGLMYGIVLGIVALPCAPFIVAGRMFSTPSLEAYMVAAEIFLYHQEIIDSAGPLTGWDVLLTHKGTDREYREGTPLCLPVLPHDFPAARMQFNDLWNMYVEEWRKGYYGPGQHTFKGTLLRDYHTKDPRQAKHSLYALREILKIITNAITQGWNIHKGWAMQQQARAQGRPMRVGPATFF